MWLSPPTRPLKIQSRIHRVYATSATRASFEAFEYATESLLKSALMF